MDINNTARNGVDGVLGDDFAESGEYAKIWLVLLDDRQKVATALNVMNWDIILARKRINGKRFADVGGREDECDDFVLGTK